MAVTGKIKPDWKVLKLQYVSTTMSLRQLAEAHGINEAGVMQRAHREKWEAERQRMAIQVTEEAQKRMLAEKADTLASLSKGDIQLAKSIRNRLAKWIKKMEDRNITISPNELATIARALESTQRTTRLALNATTENTGISSPEGGPVKVAEQTPEEYKEVLREFFTEFTR